MRLSKHQLAMASSLVFLLGGAVAQAQDSTPDKQALIDRLEAMQKTIDELHNKVNSLEKEKQGTAPASGAENKASDNNAGAASARGTPAPVPSSSVQVSDSKSWGPAPSAGEQGLPATPMPNRPDTTGRLVSSSRPDNAPIDPQFKGFMRLFGTDTYFKLGGYVRVNLNVNNKEMADNTEMVPSGIPVKGEANYGSGENVSFHGKASRIDFELRRNTELGALRIYYENDFYGSSNDYFSYHFRQFYAQLGNLLAGQASTTFTDDDIWPDIIDYQGPNSAAYVRQVQIRYIVPLMKSGDDNMHMAFAIEQPDSEVDLTGAGAGADSKNRMPDFTARWRYESPRWHVQLAGLARDISYRDGDDNGQSVFGGGLSLTGGMTVFEKDRIGAQLAYGYGIGRYFQDASGHNTDAALTSGGDLRPLETLGAYLTYTHHWNDQFRSSLTGGYLNIDNESGQAGDAFHRSVYASANLVWQPTRDFWVGAEVLYGYNRHNDGNHGDAWQVQLAVNYALVE
ncbi:MAG: porin [Puniceicoccales bacterium]|jgi:hypothetical protein|nr:porin [Puniceicoccales bacterium]